MLKRSRVAVCVTAFLTTAFFTFLQSSHGEDRAMSPLEVADKLDAALVAAESIRDPEMEIAHLQSAAEEAVKAMSANVFVADAFLKLEKTKESDPRKWTKQWRAAVKEARDILRFEPKEEAPRPEGFPELTPVGEIRLQHYPKYRLAKTDMTLIEGRAFWTLFNHIKEREIAMTAPVEMTYADDEKATKKTSMSFLYRSTEQGELGAADKVEVLDVPAQMAISIGIRGSANKERVADAKSRLETWLAAHQDEYESCGPLRVMSHNSPFVADNKQYSEVQLPVRIKEDRPETTPKSN